MSSDKYYKELQSLKYFDEEKLIEKIINESNWLNDEEISINAESIVEKCRSDRNKTKLDNFFLEYGLSNQEGVALMCLAESLLRIPDNSTCDEIIEEKIGGKSWLNHLNNSPSLFVNATTFGLFLAEQVVELDPKIGSNPISWLSGMTSKIGEPVLREAIKKGMDILSEEFVSGTSIEKALTKFDSPNTPCSFDMLGEAARTKSDVDFFFEAYENAIRCVGEKNALLSKSFHEISIKLSALHPRYEALKEERVMNELYESVYELSLQAANQDIALTIDAEEQDRLELSLKIIEKLAENKKLKDWGGLGLAIQGYGRRSSSVVKFIDYLGGRRNGLMMRLVKGAYWDQEVKIHQTKGSIDLPVFTAKSFTDLNYLHTAKVISESKNLKPYFATHNAHTIAAIMSIFKGQEGKIEFQRIFGMGDLVYTNAKKCFKDFPTTRIYAPVGSKKELLPYLVRRLIENGANNSFVNKYLDKKIPITEVVKNPLLNCKDQLINKTFLNNVKRPKEIFKGRENSLGFDFGDLYEIKTLQNDVKNMRKRDYKASSILGNHEFTGESIKRLSPHELKNEIGSVKYLKTKEIKHVFKDFDNSDWSKTSLKKRIEILSKVGELLSNNRAMLFHLLINEAGKTLKDCDAELREAIDFINYYNAQAKKIFKRKRMPGPSGEENYLEHAPKGTFLCISPWNFPLAIFVGQITAALVTGNNVIAKPAEDTSIIGCEVVKIFHESGVPKSALKLVLGDKKIGNELTKNPLIAGVAFTGSSFAAKQINKNLADSNGPIKSLIAETGGQNAMIVDSSSLKEQVIDDVIRSAFLSAGQRCSALRVLYVQDEIADEYWDYLNEALQEYTIGDPNLPKVDIGPIINKNSKDRLMAHISALKKSARRTIEHHHKQNKGDLFITPIVFEIDSINQIDEENFGPILHFIRYKNENLQQVIDEINNTGYGLTMGVHSRIVSKARRIFEAANVGNFYFNRDIVGAVVGVQPFGGQGLSGTGPKAGGPGYLYNFVTEKTYTDNVMATGGNIELLNKNAM